MRSNERSDVLRAVMRDKGKFHDLLEEYRQSGKLDQMRAMGIVIKYASARERYETAIVLYIADYAIDNKFHVTNPYSQEGIELGKVYNAAIGRINAVVEGLDPDWQRFYLEE
jgi:hypothetical protein